MTPPLLATRGLTKHYGGVVAVDEVSVDVSPGSITGVIGPNGAGKSTLVGLLGGALTPSAGSIAFDGADITRRRAADRARLGIGRTYQIPRPFLDMTVEDNLALAQAADRPLPAGTSAAARRTEILKKAGLEDVAMVPARNLPLLRRKRLEVARALALEPRLLLLDEVGAGLIDSEVTELIALIRDVAVEGVTILIVEHVLRIVRECCSSLVVLNFGKVLATGTPGAVLGSDEVAAVYLGTARDRRTLPTESVSGAAPVDGPSVGRLNLDPLIGPTSQVSAASPMLEVRAVTAAHGQAVVLRDVSLKLGTGEVVAVLGANGAGKTSLAQVITGALRPRTGSVHLAGEAMEGARPDQFATRGVAHCMEGRRIFTDLTVEQNLRIGARATTDAEARLDAVYR